MVLPKPPSPLIPIPNNPFYYPETNYIRGEYGPFIIGSGLSLDYQSGILSATGGGGGAVSSVIAGAGISVSSTTGNVTVANTGVLTVTAGSNISLAGTAQNVIISAVVPAGTVTDIFTGTGLVGGPISSSGTISLANTTVTAGTYTNPILTVNDQGQITNASNGVVVGSVSGVPPIVVTGTTNPVISIQSASTTQSGAVQLSDSTSSTLSTTAATSKAVNDVYNFAATKVSAVSVTSPVVDTGTALNPNIGVQTATTGQLGAVQVGANIDVAGGLISVKTSSTTQSGIVQLNNTLSSTSDTEALTAAQGKNLQDQISALGAASNLTLAGTFDAATSQMLSVSLDGSAAGFTVGSDLIAPAPGNADYFVIVTTPGSYSPPGGGGPYTANQGDWFLSNGTVWQFLNVGTDLPIASTGTAGIVELADTAETQAGTSTTLAVTPAGAAGTYIPLSALTAKGVLIGASGANTLATVPAGTSGQFLVVDPSASSGLNWQTLTLNFIPESTFTAAGELIAGTGAGTYAALPVGTDGQSLIACAAAPTGLCWANISVSNATPLVAGIVFGCTSSTALTNTQFGYCSGASGAFESVYVGYQAAPADTGACNTFVGYQAGNLHTTGGNNVAIGHQAMQCHVNGVQNVAIGQQAMQCANGISINNNIAIGRRALCQVQGRDNIAIGYTAGCDITTGCRNFAFGPNVQVPSPTGCCQLAVGFGSGQYWVVGTSDKSICLGGALRDCTNSTGTAGQVLCSTGTAIQWSNPSAYGDTPVGAVNWFASTTAPAGWLVADGTAVSRTTYAALFAVIGTTYGTGDGSTTFNLPDLRGQFLRGWDAAGGTARGCDPGRAFGSSQGFALQTHCHEMQVISGGAGRPEWACPNLACPAGAGYPSPTGTPVRSGGFTSTNGSTETRPTNVAMLPCIKWQVTTAPSSCGIPCSCITAKGAIITGNAASTPVALPSGINGQVLTVNTACSLGLEWAVPSTSSTWTSAGTIQSVGISATATAPTVGTTLINNVRYRQIGPKEWEVQGVLHQTGAGTAGNGYYLFTLPAGLQFDVSSPYQKPYTGVPDNNQGWYFSGLINSWTMIANVGSSTYGRASITPYDATRYRISGNADYGVPNYLSQGWYQLSTAPLWYKWGFTFETP